MCASVISRGFNAQLDIVLPSCRTSLYDIPATAITHRDLQPQAVVAGGLRLGGGDHRLQAHRQRTPLADEAHPHPLACSSPISRSSASRNRLISPTLRRAAAPSFRWRRRTASAPRSRRREHSSITMRAGAMPALCPACRGRPRARAQRPLPSMMIATWRAGSSLVQAAQTCMISFSLAASSWSMSATYLSVSFCTRSRHGAHHPAK